MQWTPFYVFPILYVVPTLKTFRVCQFQLYTSLYYRRSSEIRFITPGNQRKLLEITKRKLVEIIFALPFFYMHPLACSYMQLVARSNLQLHAVTCSYKRSHMQRLPHTRSHMQHLPLTPNMFCFRKKDSASSRNRTRDTSQCLESHRDALNHYTMEAHVLPGREEACVSKRNNEI